MKKKERKKSLCSMANYSYCNAAGWPANRLLSAAVMSQPQAATMSFRRNCHVRLHIHHDENVAQTSCLQAGWKPALRHDENVAQTSCLQAGWKPALRHDENVAQTSCLQAGWKPALRHENVAQTSCLQAGWKPALRHENVAQTSCLQAGWKPALRHFCGNLFAIEDSCSIQKRCFPNDIKVKAASPSITERLCAAVIFVLLFSFCFLISTGAAQILPANTPASDDFLYAQKLFNEGYYDLSISQLRLFMQRYPDARETAEAWRLMGEANLA
ncbi:MAG: hypothetical protein ONB44_14375, partial [candidate division KSB1 bacterium]|nr:hypothetical protein [candidate division KSB1 bacterium]